MTENFYYLKNNLEGMNEDERVLFIYGELVKILGQAQEYMKMGKVEPRVTAINKSIDVIYALLSVLNIEGGAITSQLRSLYLYAVNQLSTANYRQSKPMLDEVAKIFRELHQTWSEKIKNDKIEIQNHEPQSTEKRNAPIQGQMGGVELYG